MRLVNEHSSSESSCGSAGMQQSRYSQFEKRARFGAYSRALARVVRRQIILNAYNRDVALQRRLFDSGKVAQLFPGQSVLKNRYRWMRENSPQMIKLDEDIIEALQQSETLDEIEGIIAIQYQCESKIKFVYDAVLEAAKPNIDKRKNAIDELADSLRNSETKIVVRQDSLKEIVKLQQEYEERKADEDLENQFLQDNLTESYKQQFVSPTKLSMQSQKSFWAASSKKSLKSEIQNSTPGAGSGLLPPI